MGLIKSFTLFCITLSNHIHQFYRCLFLFCSMCFVLFCQGFHSDLLGNLQYVRQQKTIELTKASKSKTGSLKNAQFCPMLWPFLSPCTGKPPALPTCPPEQNKEKGKEKIVTRIKLKYNIYIILNWNIHDTWKPNCPWVILPVLCLIVVMLSAAIHSSPIKKKL